jgi:ElaB/YqjD/DUF883 family membrane-anchored ribosome-binding protein
MKNNDGNTLEKILPQTEEAMEYAKTKGREYMGLMKTKQGNLLDSAWHKGRKNWNQSKTYIQKNPAKSIVVALAAGAVLTGLFFTGQRLWASFSKPKDLS